MLILENWSDLLRFAAMTTPAHQTPLLTACTAAEDDELIKALKYVWVAAAAAESMPECRTPDDTIDQQAYLRYHDKVMGEAMRSIHDVLVWRRRHDAAALHRAELDVARKRPSGATFWVAITVAVAMPVVAYLTGGTLAILSALAGGTIAAGCIAVECLARGRMQVLRWWRASLEQKVSGTS